SGLRRIGPCRRRRQAAQDRLDRRETTLDRGGGGTPPRRASGHTPRPNRNSRVRLAGKLRARILHRRTDGGIRPAHGAVARRLRAQAIGRRKVAENSALSRTDQTHLCCLYRMAQCTARERTAVVAEYPGASSGSDRHYSRNARKLAFLEERGPKGPPGHSEESLAWPISKT